MAIAKDPRKHIEFPAEGFTILLDSAGIELRVDDHHPLPLRLSWTRIEQMRQEAQCRSGTGRGLHEQVGRQPG